MANTKVTKAVLADDAVGLAQLDITNDPSDGQALTAVANPNGYTLTWANNTVAGISSSADATAITIDSSERVGVGVTSMSNKLVVGGTEAADTTYLRLQNTPATAATHKVAMEFWGNEGTANGSTYNMGRIYGEFDGSNYSDSRLTLGSASGNGTFNDEINIKNGKVGIGVVPTHNFNLQASGTVEARFRSTDGDCSLQISSDTDEGQDSILEFTSGTSGRGRIVYDHNPTAADQKMIFKTGDVAVDAMEIDGIGRLKLLTKDSLRISTMNALGQTGSGAMFILGHNAHVDPDNNNKVLAMNTSWYPSFIKMYYNQGISFHTSSSFYAVGDTLLDGVGANSLERMRIMSNGAIGMGFTGQISGATLSVYSSADGGIVIGSSSGTNAFRKIYHDPNSGILYFTSTGNAPYLSNAGGWTNASDKAIKKNISNINYGLSTVESLQPRKYKMKADGENQVGFIAQEMESVIPELVSGEEGKKGINYGQLTAVLTKAIQELKTELDAAKTRIETLENN